MEHSQWEQYSEYTLHTRAYTHTRTLGPLFALQLENMNWGGGAWPITFEP